MSHNIPAFFYPTITLDTHGDWNEYMLDNWVLSGKKYFAFAFSKFRPRTLPNGPFWIYFL